MNEYEQKSVGSGNWQEKGNEAGSVFASLPWCLGAWLPGALGAATCVELVFYINIRNSSENYRESLSILFWCDKAKLYSIDQHVVYWHCFTYFWIKCSYKVKTIFSHPWHKTHKGRPMQNCSKQFKGKFIFLTSKEEQEYTYYRHRIMRRKSVNKALKRNQSLASFSSVFRIDSTL